MALYKGSIEIAGAGFGSNSSIISGGSGGGVIDGTLLKSMTPINVPTNATSFTYTVENDCLLYIECTGEDIEGWGTGEDYLDIYVNESRCGRLCDYAVTNTTSGDEDYPSYSIPVKGGSVITIKGDGTHKCFDDSATVNFYEYKLTSLAPQIAMPDWDNSKAIPIVDSSISTSAGSYNITKNGYIRIQHGDAVHWNVTVNNIPVCNTWNSTANVPDDTIIVPVSKNDIVEWNQVQIGSTSASAHMDFYPAKVVEAKLNVDHKYYRNPNESFSDWDETVTELPDGTTHIHVCAYGNAINSYGGTRYLIPSESRLNELDKTKLNNNYDRFYAQLTPYTNGNGNLCSCSPDQFSTSEEDSSGVATIGVHAMEFSFNGQTLSPNTINFTIYFQLDGYIGGPTIESNSAT